MVNRCRRCGQVIKGEYAVFGPECIEKAKVELLAWSIKVLGETPAEFLTGCCEDWGSDYDQSGEEYIAEHGIDVNDFFMQFEYLAGHFPLHGTIWSGRGKNIRVIFRGC
jgi:hypothetical protein